MSVVLAQGALAQQQPQVAGLNPLIRIETAGKGPGERVTGFVVDASAAGARLPDAKVEALAKSLSDRGAQYDTDAAVDLGMLVLGISVGGANMVGTLAEHALWFEAWGPANTALNHLGLTVTLAQVALDVARGDDRAAFVDGLKGYMGFAISKWGWGALQIGGTALFVVDVTLTLWQKGLTQIGDDVWSCRYLAWYKANGRSVNDWKAKAWELYLAAEGRDDQSYDVFLDGTLNDYVGLAFRDDMLATYGNCSASSFGDQAAIREAIMARHKAVLRKMLADKVMPEIAARAFRRQLAGQAAEATRSLMPRLNRTFRLEVTAYGVEGPARVVMPLPAGGEWAGKLREDGTFRAELTLYAVMKAGFPDTIRLEIASGSEERKLVMADDRVTAMFGAPVVSSVVRYRLTEGPQACTVTRIAPDGSKTTETAQAEARPVQEVDFALLENNTWIFGRYSPDGSWSPASPGVSGSAGLTFGAPLFDNIRAFRNCAIGMFVGDKVATSDCKVERWERKAVSARVTIERLCTASVKMDMMGAFVALGEGEMQYHSLEGAEAQEMIEGIRSGLENGIEGYTPGAIPGLGGMSDIPGMPSLP
jgi:hypothetical protein